MTSPRAESNMSGNQKTAGKQAAVAPMSVFERYLTVWVFLCIVAGIALGHFLPGLFAHVGVRIGAF